jgi:hypothetical protein
VDAYQGAVGAVHSTSSALYPAQRSIRLDQSVGDDRIAVLGARCLHLRAKGEAVVVMQQSLERLLSPLEGPRRQPGE